MVHLDDANETVVFLPYTGDQQHLSKTSAPELPFDLPNGTALRWDAYKAAWNKCLGRIQALMHQLYAPIVADTVEKIELAYSPTNDGDPPMVLPHAEIPTFAVANSGSDAYFISSIASRLHPVVHLYPSDCPNLTTAMKSIINGFLAASKSASNLKSSAKTLAAYDIGVLLAWFIAQKPNTKPRNLIVLLHDFEQFDPGVVQDMFHICSQHVPTLPLILILSLSSPQSPLSPQSYLHVNYPRATLKLLRIQSVVVPTSPKILEDVVIDTFVNFSDTSDEVELFLGPTLLEYVTEYATRFNHSVSALLNVLQLAYLKHFLTNPLTSLVHLMLRDQYTDSELQNILQDPTSVYFRNVLVQRLALSRIEHNANSDLESSTPALIRALRSAHTQFRARSHAIRLAYSLLQGLHEFLVEKGYKGLGSHWGSGTSTTSTLSSKYPQYSRLQNFINLLQLHTRTRANPHSKQSEKDFAYSHTLVRKLKPDELRAYLNVLIATLEGVPNGLEDIFTVGEDGDGGDDKSFDLPGAVRMLKGWRAEVDGAHEAGSEDGDRAKQFKAINENLAEWMYDCLRILTQPIEDTPLWDIWYTGAEVFPSETINPSIRASIIAGLLRPEEFAASTEVVADPQGSRGDSGKKNGLIRTRSHTHTSERNLVEPGPSLPNHQLNDSSDSEETGEDEVPLHTLPDTSILFHRYLESGKIINVYDWFESFHAVLNVQRREAITRSAKERERDRIKGKGKEVSRNTSPEKKGKGTGKKSSRGKGKVKGTTDEGADADVNMDAQKELRKEQPDSNPDSDETQQILVQARFIRALHELDFLGLIKHTRRKPDHVLRTLFEVGD
ncbi:origin recognition complex subunit 3 N-terminus-domain-containing protein [Lentinula raphanica]|nr:origin recognition complex subunit 3 N-terminus-domain-containing protein [Lentinula raphanica]